jgi:signal transduction histidine kinase
VRPSDPDVWTAELIASAVIPLLVALLNLLVAGYALTAGLRDRRKLAFAAGPAGVGMWALAWFISVFNPESLEDMRMLGTAGGSIAMSGFALDVLLELPRRIAVRLATLGAAFAAIAAGALFLFLRTKLGSDYEADLGSLGARVLSLSAALVACAGRWTERRHDDPAIRRMARWCLVSAAVTGIGFSIFTALALAGARSFVDPLLFVVLLAELFALAYVVTRRIDVHVLLSRAITYSSLAIVVAAVAALLFAQLGYRIDLALLSLTVATSLMAAALFMGLSEPITRRVERLVFPKHARIEAALAASKGELSALKRRLERAEKLAIAGELAASVAHEIKNPLAPIKGYAQLLHAKLNGLPEEQRELFEKGLRISREETERIDRRVAELLDMARAERTRASSEEQFDLNRVVIEAAAVAEGEPGLLRLERRLDPAAGMVAGNADEMRGALLNLMKNAAEAKQGATLEVITRRDGERAIVEIADDGPGIPPEASERVFQAFYTTKAGGTGLGLAIAKSAVEAAGGTIALSPREGGGTVARIELRGERGDG